MLVSQSANLAWLLCRGWLASGNEGGTRGIASLKEAEDGKKGEINVGGGAKDEDMKGSFPKL
jgi:hypothetical protein